MSAILACNEIRQSRCCGCIESDRPDVIRRSQVERLDTDRTRDCANKSDHGARCETFTVIGARKRVGVILFPSSDDRSDSTLMLESSQRSLEADRVLGGDQIRRVLQRIIGCRRAADRLCGSCGCEVQLCPHEHHHGGQQHQPSTAPHPVMILVMPVQPVKV